MRSRNFAGVYVQVEAFPVMDEQRVVFRAIITGLHPYRFFETDSVMARTEIEVRAYFHGFMKELKKKYPVEWGVTYDVRVPNLFSAFVNSRPLSRVDRKWVFQSARQQGKTAMSTLASSDMADAVAFAMPKIDSFEVNLTEPLVGWKSWKVVGGKLCTSYNTLWLPGESLEAQCPTLGPTHRCEQVPNEKHSCGIYSSDERALALGYLNDQNSVFGQMYGWGRYVRGENGFRCQFAYPKMFLVHENQVGLIDMLKEYRVPIFVQQPMKIYDPAEDGYATFESLQQEMLDEHRNDKANGNERADEDSGPAED